MSRKNGNSNNGKQGHNMQDKITYLGPEEIVINPAWNARSGDFTKFVDPETGQGWDNFVASIHADGVQDPLEARKNDKGKFELIAGFRRYTASQTTSYKNEKGESVKVVKIDKLPVIIRDMTEEEARLRNLAENTARESLKGPDLAWGIQEYFKAGGSKLTDSAIANALGMSQPYVSKLHKIMTEVKPGITKQWRESSKPVTVTKMYDLTKIDANRQDEEFKKLLEVQAGSNGIKGKDAWKDTLKKSAYDLGLRLGALERLELVSVSDNPEKPGVGVDGLMFIDSGVLKVKEGANLAVRKAAARKFIEGFNTGLKDPESTDDDEDEDEGDE